MAIFKSIFSPSELHLDRFTILPSRKEVQQTAAEFLEELTARSDTQGHRIPNDIDDYADPSSNPICGTDNGEEIHGTDRRDVIDAKGGDDTVYAYDGDDTVFGRKGADKIDGGNGSDKLSGGSGDDTIYAGDDGWLNILNGGAGSDELKGAKFATVTDVFQFTIASETAPDERDMVRDFFTGEDFIHLAFDGNIYQPGTQGFALVDKDDAGAAGTMCIADELVTDIYGSPLVYGFTLYGHTDNDGVADFAIDFRGGNDGAVDWGNDVWPSEMISQDDFIFG